MLFLTLVAILVSSNVAFNHALAPPISSSTFVVNKSLSTARTSILMAHRKPLDTRRMKALNNRSDGGGINNNYHNVVMMLRGGTSDSNGENDDEYDSSSNEESEEYDDASSDEEKDSTEDDDNVEEEEESDSDIITVEQSDDNNKKQQQPSPEEIERAQQYTQLSSQSRNLGISTALWASLFFDSILNTAKRADLFPTATTSASSAILSGAASYSSLSATMVPTALLASGFGLASVISFLLWRDMEVRADVLSSDDGSSSSKGDAFLSLASPTSSATTNDDYSKEEGGSSSIEKLASQTRTRLYLHLSIFGLLSLGAHGGYYFSNHAPFLGMSAAIINIHNTLACVSALMKETKMNGLSLRELSMMWPVSLFQSKKKKGEKEGKSTDDDDRLELSSFIFRLGTIATLLRCIPVCRHIYESITSLQSLSSSVATAILAGKSNTKAAELLTNGARLLSLKIATLARLTLVAGASHSLYNSNKKLKMTKNGDPVSLCHHPFFNVLSGMLGLGSVAVGGTIMFDTFIHTTKTAYTLGRGIGKGMMIVIFGMFALWNAVVGYQSS